MSSQIIPIANFRTGFDTYDQPEEMANDAYPLIFDVLLFRGVLTKRDGFINLIRPPTFAIDNITNAPNGVVTTAANHGFTTGDQVLISGVGGMTQVNNPAIQPYTITVLTPTTFELNIDTSLFGIYTIGGVVSRIAFVGPLGITNITQAPNGVVTTLVNHNLTSGQAIFIQNVQGMTEINSVFVPYIITVLTPTTFQLNVNTTTFGAYVAGGTITEPIQGLEERQTQTFFKDLIAFTESQAYLFNPTLNEFVNISGSTVWTGDDTRFFWSMNFQNSFWATNNVDPIRYYISGTTWTNYRPILFGITHTNEALGPGIPALAVAYGPFSIANPPIIPATVIVNIAAGMTEPAVRLTDDGNGNLTSVTAGYSGTVNYVTGAITLTVLADANVRSVTVTYDEEGDRLERALMIFPYKDRFIALDTTEGAGFVEHPIRARYSQNGTVYVSTPVPSGFTFNAQAWRQDVPGRGGFIDAPTDERIISAGFVRDMLIVLFEFSAWRLRYTSNEAIPFVWERINSQLGAESTYSVVGFDEGILTVGRTGIIITDTNQSVRIDQIIPDQVYQITNINNAQRRVQGIRDFQRQLAYWTFPEGDAERYPNRTLVYNYIEKNWTVYRQSFTTFGQFRRDDSLTWGTALNTWQDEDSLWGSGDLAAGFPVVVAGNRIGQVFFIDRRINTDDDVPFNFFLQTKKFNPFIDQGMQCKAIYMYLLLSGTDNGQITIQHLIDEDPSVIVATYTVSTATSGQDKVWRRVELSAVSAQYQQFNFLFSDEQMADPTIPLKDVEIYKMLLEIAPAGRLNYGVT